MATVIFIKEGAQNPSVMHAVINYCIQERKTFDSNSKRRLISGINCDGENSYRAKKESQRIAESYYPTGNNISGGIYNLTGAVSRIIDDDSEDPEERRKRIEGQENGAAIGALIGAGVGLITGIANKEEAQPQEPDDEDEDNSQRKEILREVFDEDDYDDDFYDDEDEGFIMSM